MPFQMPCPHKECAKMQEPYIDPKTEEVYCGICDQKITVNHFQKIQLKTLKQYRVKKKVSFAVKCPKCNKEERPISTEDDIVCGSCHAPLDHLSDTFKRMLKMQLKKVDKEL